MLNQVYISFGSNLGDLQANIEQALTLLQADSNLQIKRQSAFYQTTPVGPVKQADFINGALEITTSYSPIALLAVLQNIEQKCQRERLIHWGPRTLDLDIIFFNQLEFVTADLTLPHPETFNRLFVLVPILEICAPDFYQRTVIEKQIADLTAQHTQSITKIAKNEVNHDR